MWYTLAAAMFPAQAGMNRECQQNTGQQAMFPAQAGMNRFRSRSSPQENMFPAQAGMNRAALGNSISQ